MIRKDLVRGIRRIIDDVPGSGPHVIEAGGLRNLLVAMWGGSGLGNSG